MDKLKKLITYLMVVCLLAAALPVAFAANDAEAEAGEIWSAEGGNDGF